MRITKKPFERKKEIINAALMLFATKGYNKTTINDILKEVRVAKGTFYYYFQSKEELMEYIITSYIAEDIERAKSIAASDLKSTEKIFQIITKTTYAKVGEDSFKLMKILHEKNNTEIHQKAIIESTKQITPILTNVLQQGIDEGIFSTDYPEESIEFILGASNFLYDIYHFNCDEATYLKKIYAGAKIMERILDAKEGTFDFIYDHLKQMMALFKDIDK